MDMTIKVVFFILNSIGVQNLMQVGFAYFGQSRYFHTIKPSR